MGEDEACANPDGAGAEHESGSNGLAVENTAGGNDLDGTAGQRRLVALAGLDDRGDEDGGGNVAGVATALTALGADDVHAEREALGNVLGVADHVHVEDSVLVQAVNDVLGRHTDGRDEKLGALGNDDVNQLIELALGVIVAMVKRSRNMLADIVRKPRSASRLTVCRLAEV